MPRPGDRAFNAPDPLPPGFQMPAGPPQWMGGPAGQSPASPIAQALTSYGQPGMAHWPSNDAVYGGQAVNAGAARGAGNVLYNQPAPYTQFEFPEYTANLLAQPGAARGFGNTPGMAANNGAARSPVLSALLGGQ